MPHYASIDELLAAAALPDQPEHVGDWYTVDQARIDAFAEATDDRQWIHTDPLRAATGPFGVTIAHGFLTLSLIPYLTAGAISVDGTGMRVNYGLDRVRFTSPVPVDSRIRARTVLAEATPVNGGACISLAITIEIDGQQRPALVATQIVLVVQQA